MRKAKVAKIAKNSFVLYYEPAPRGHELARYQWQRRSSRLHEAFFDGHTWWWRRFRLSYIPRAYSHGLGVSVTAWQNGTSWIDGPPGHWEIDREHRAVGKTPLRL